MRELLVGHIAFPVTNYLYNRKRILSHYRGMLKTERHGPDQLQDLQLEKIKGLVRYVYEHVPYYRNLFDRLALKPSDIRTLSDISKIPPLGRRDLVEKRQELIDSRYLEDSVIADRSGRPPGEPLPFAPFRRHKMVRNTSSGSTGAPTVFYEDGSRTALNWAYELRLKKWYGVRPGEREARLARLATAYDPDSRSLALRKALWNQLILPGTNLSEKEYSLSVDRIRDFRPATLWGYTSALTGLAEYVKTSGLDPSPWKIRLIISWAAPLYAHEKTLLEDVFRCPVTNIYGAREVGHIAAVCPAGSFHINQENLIVESEKTENGATEGGELLVTNLDRSPMPLIRYRMGDIGEVGNMQCGCGRTLQILSKLIGRTGEIFITKEGRMISPNFWCRVFMTDKHAGQIRRFQVIYTKEKNLRVVVVKGSGYSEETENYIRGMVRDNFSSDTGLEIQCVPGIAPHVSGKYQMVINEGN
jgi:phenylacetate-CoA ligase